MWVTCQPIGARGRPGGDARADRGRKGSGGVGQSLVACWTRHEGLPGALKIQRMVQVTHGDVDTTGGRGHTPTCLTPGPWGPQPHRPPALMGPQGCRTPPPPLCLHSGETRPSPGTVPPA